MLRRRVIMLMFGVGLWSGCAKTKMTSSLSPTASGRTYDRILVVFPVPDPGVREFVENEFSAQLPDVFIPGYLVLPPNRDYSNVEVLDHLDEENIDAMLLVKLSDAGTATKAVQQSRTTACSRSNRGRRGCYEGFTAPSGGGTIEQDWAFFETSLMDMSTFEVVWTGSAESKGSQFSGSDDVLRSMVRKAVERLRADGVVR